MGIPLLSSVYDAADLNSEWLLSKKRSSSPIATYVAEYESHAQFDEGKNRSSLKKLTYSSLTI
jgi:hypothetical protein